MSSRSLVRQLRRPFAGQATSPPGNAIASAESKRGRFGALRASDIAKNPSIWDIDVTQSGKMCVTNASKIQLWRPESESEVKINIRSSDGKSQELELGRGQGIGDVASRATGRGRR